MGSVRNQATQGAIIELKEGEIQQTKDSKGFVVWQVDQHGNTKQNGKSIKK